MADPSAGGGPSPSAPLEWEDSEPSERQMNGFVLVFLVVIAFCMILSHQMGHKFKVRGWMVCVFRSGGAFRSFVPS